MDRSSQGLHVNGGTGETSYANNSLVQRKVLSMTMPITEEAITSLYCNTSLRSLAIADFGCASGPNTLENNKGNIYMASTSPPDVLRAYHAQFQRDFSMFLKCRAEELVAGGRMVLTILGRSEDPSSKECCHIWDLLAMALNDMVSKGLIAEEKMDSLNVPTYNPPPTEVKSEVLKEGSFSIDRLQVSEIDLLGYDVVNLMRAAVEPMLVRQIGDAIIEEVFSRYREILSDCIPKETPRFFNVTISATKRA